MSKASNLNSMSEQKSKIISHQAGLKDSHMKTGGLPENKQARFKEQVQVVLVSKSREEQAIKVNCKDLCACLATTLRRITKGLDALRSCFVNSSLEESVALHAKAQSCGMKHNDSSTATVYLRMYSHALSELLTGLQHHEERHMCLHSYPMFLKEIEAFFELSNIYRKTIADVIYRKLRRIASDDRIKSIQHCDVYLELLLYSYGIVIPDKDEVDYPLLELLSDFQIGMFEHEYQKKFLQALEVDSGGHSLALAAAVQSKEPALEVISAALLRKESQQSMNSGFFLSVLSAGMMAGGRKVWSNILQFVLQRISNMSTTHPAVFYRGASLGLRTFEVSLARAAERTKFDKYAITVDKNEESLQIDILKEEQSVLSLQVKKTQNEFRFFRKCSDSKYRQVHSLLDMVDFSSLCEQVERALQKFPGLLFNMLSFSLESNKNQAKYQPHKGFLCFGTTSRISGVQTKKFSLQYQAEFFKPGMFPLSSCKPGSAKSLEEYLALHYSRSPFPFEYYSEIRLLGEDAYEKKYVELVADLTSTRPNKRVNGQVRKYKAHLQENAATAETVCSTVFVSSPSANGSQYLPWDMLRQVLFLIAIFDTSAIWLARLVNYQGFAKLANDNIAGADLKLGSKLVSHIRLVEAKTSTGLELVVSPTFNSEERNETHENLQVLSDHGPSTQAPTVNNDNPKQSQEFSSSTKLSPMLNPTAAHDRLRFPPN